MGESPKDIFQLQLVQLGMGLRAQEGIEKTLYGKSAKKNIKTIAVFGQQHYTLWQQGSYKEKAKIKGYLWGFKRPVEKLLKMPEVQGIAVFSQSILEYLKETGEFKYNKKKQHHTYCRGKREYLIFSV